MSFLLNDTGYKYDTVVQEGSWCMEGESFIDAEMVNVCKMPVVDFILSIQGVYC